MKHFPRAFTLIELLIVVAIIAILAAIAVPNFLEAQVRSKVSRTKADMRSVVVAIQSYRVDYNNYPPAKQDPDQEKYNNNLLIEHKDTTMRASDRATTLLTTPIAYITTLPVDVFAGQGHPLYKNVGFWYLNISGAVADTEWGTGSESAIIRGLVGNDPKIRFNGEGSPVRQTHFVLASPGPGNPNAGPFAIQGYTRYPNQVARYFTNGTPALSSSFPNAAEYDPTNGTVSKGTIYTTE